MGAPPLTHRILVYGILELLSQLFHHVGAGVPDVHTVCLRSDFWACLPPLMRDTRGSLRSRHGNDRGGGGGGRGGQLAGRLSEASGVVWNQVPCTNRFPDSSPLNIQAPYVV